MAAKLTAKQEAFCQEYMIDLNGSQAAVRAGYSEKTAKEIGCENLTKPNIAERIAELQKARSKRVEMDADYVLSGLKQVAERCMQAEPVMIRDGEQMIESGEFKFEHSGANRAYELLGKHLKLFTDKTEVTGENGADLFRAILSDISEGSDGLPKPKED